MALDYGCYLADHDALNDLARANGLRVIHDAAHSFGSSSMGRPVGTFTDICMFSFDPVKCLTAVDAGVLMLADADEERLAREVRILGSDQPPEVMYKNARTWDYDAVRIGFRYHLSNIHASLGSSQIAKLPRIRANRQSACQRYAERLKGYDALRAPFGTFDEVNPFLYFIRVPAEIRDPLRAAMKDAGIDTGLHWRPAHHHTYFKQFRTGPLPVSEAAGADVISLPLHSSPMSDEVIDRVCDAVINFVR
jgi:dTDP-4-amino-4,6-dideoxygalactose transaminase